VSWLVVALGAGAGAGARHLLDRAVTRGRFPTGILVVNLLGSLLAGVVAGAAPGPRASDLLAVGVLGGFTTASTLAVDVLRLHRDGSARLALLDVALSVGPGLVLAAVGLALGRSL
jgi:CrcB protein